jgi:hypothetical protein
MNPVSGIVELEVACKDAEDLNGDGKEANLIVLIV